MPSGAKASKLKFPKPKTPWDNLTKHELFLKLRDIETRIEKQRRNLEKLQAEKDQFLWFILSEMEDDT